MILGLVAQRLDLRLDRVEASTTTIADMLEIADPLALEPAIAGSTGLAS